MFFLMIKYLMDPVTNTPLVLMSGVGEYVHFTEMADQQH
jgi:hypothetical protein